MFLGEHYLQFTGRGRVVLPRRFRGELGKDKEIVLSRGLDGCIWGFNKLDWEKEAVKQLETPITDREARDIRRYLFSAAEAVELDEQGRFIIPKGLVDYSGLDEKVVLIGAGDHFEIWEPQRWKEILINLTDETADKTNQLREKN